MSSITRDKGQALSAKRVNQADMQQTVKPNATSVNRVSRTPGNTSDMSSRATAIEQCVQQELRRYFDMLDGEEPANLYRMVIRQTEHAVIDVVMKECRGNQTRASEWLSLIHI